MRVRILSLSLAIAVLDGGNASAAVIQVPSQQATIQAAIDLAAAGDTVLVDPGLYPETLDFLGKSITVASQFLIAGDPELIAQTVIDGGGAGTVVSFLSGEGASSQLTGFTITGGHGDYGGGIACAQSSPTLSHLVVENNQAIGGAGIHCSDGASPQLSASVLRLNSAGISGTGGGLRCSGYASPVLREVRIENNEALHGGGVHCYWHSDPVFMDVVVSGNLANSTLPSSPSGGGIYAGGESSPRLERVLLIANRAGSVGGNLSGRGGGVFCSGGSTILLANVTLSGNLATFAGGALHCLGNARPILVNTIAWGDSPEEIYVDADFDPSTLVITHSDLRGGKGGIVLNDNAALQWLPGNIAQDPLFIAGQFDLTEDSPCVDAGTDLFVLEGDTLVALDPEDYSGEAPDMGALEFQDPTAAPGDSDLALDLSPPRSYPNPFSQHTTLSFALSQDSRVTLALYDVRGRALRTLLQGRRAAGVHRLTLDGSELSAGVYLLELRAWDGRRGQRSTAQKLILQR